MSYTKLLYHIVFRTRNSAITIPAAHEKDLYGYIWGIIQNKQSTLYQIGGMEDHIHMLLDLQPDLSISEFVRDVKSSSSKWLKGNPDFPQFDGWGEGYAAFTYSISDLDTVRNYIKNQKEHHKTVSFAEEYRDFIVKHGVKIDEYFLKK